MSFLKLAACEKKKKKNADVHLLKESKVYYIKYARRTDENK